MIKVFVFLVALFVFHWSSSPPFPSIVTSLPITFSLLLSPPLPINFSLLLSPPLPINFSLLLSPPLPVNLFTSVVTSSSHQLFTSVVTSSFRQLFTSVVTSSSRQSFHFCCHLLFPSTFHICCHLLFPSIFSLLLSPPIPFNLFFSVPCWSHQSAVRQLRHRPSSASQELGTRQDTDHLQHHKNWKLDKTHIY